MKSKDKIEYEIYSLMKKQDNYYDSGRMHSIKTLQWVLEDEE